MGRSGGAFGVSHLKEPTVMRSKAAPNRRMAVVGDAVFFAGFLDDLGESGVVDVGHLWEEMVFDLIVESATIPR